MNNSKFFIDKTLDEYIKLLVENAYREIGHREIKAEWGRLRSFAIVTMNQEGPVMIKCNSVARAWPEPALFGLLSHELSHVIVGDVPDTEKRTDLDVIERGLGVYLAVERVILDKYSDHIIGNGKDRYLGYNSIRSLLASHQIQQLDLLMSDLGMIPSSTDILLHDFAVLHDKDTSRVLIDGHSINIDEVDLMDDIKIIIGHETVQILLNESVIGEFQKT